MYGQAASELRRVSKDVRLEPVRPKLIWQIEACSRSEVLGAGLDCLLAV